MVKVWVNNKSILRPSLPGAGFADSNWKSAPTKAQGRRNPLGYQLFFENARTRCNTVVLVLVRRS
jgi:hypothetical protein